MFLLQENGDYLLKEDGDYIVLEQAPNLALEQHSFRFRNDDGSETTATWAEPLNTHISRPPRQTARLRLLVNATGDPDPSQFQLEFRKKGSGDPWTKVE